MSTDTAGELSFLGVLAVLLRHLRLIGAFALVAGALSGGVAVIARQYAAVSRFMPHQTAEPAGNLVGVAARFGLDLGLGGGGESVEFYAQLVRSRQLLKEAVKQVYAFDTGDVGRTSGHTLSGTLMEFWDIDEPTDELAELNAVEELETRISVGTNVEVGLVTLETRARWPKLAVAINAELLSLVNRFNLERRQSQASAESAFVADRLRNAERQLNEAERELEQFLTQNRSYKDSPALAFEAGRLQRRVDLRQQVYTFLAQSYEDARIEEVRNTPVLTIVDEPMVMPLGLGELVVRGLFGVIAGFGLGVATALVLELIERQRAESPQEFEEFMGVLRSSLSSVVPGNWLVRRLGRARR